MKRLIISGALALFMGCMPGFANDIREIVFKVVQMECGNCENKVKKNLPFEKGVKSLKTDLKKRTVTITYDSEKTSAEELKKGFAKIKYDAKIISDKEVK